MNTRPIACWLLSILALPLAVCAAEIKRSPAIDTNYRAAAIQVPEGYVAELVAGPPLVRHPMMAGFDDRGRLFISESAGLNLNNKELDAQTPNYISMLEDTDGDGFFDKSTVFADKMTFPQGALWYRNALYVCSPPGLWKLEDLDNDGKAEKRTLIVGGFEYTGNAADVHGPFLGPTGRLYWCHGRKGHEVYNKDGTLVSKGKGARIWSCLPDGSDVQVFAGGGMDNPVELVFTEAGDMLGTVNLFHGRPRGDVLVHWQYGGVYPRDDIGGVLDEFVRTGDLLPEVHNFGHIAISGFNRYRSEGFGKNFKDNLFVTFFNTHKVKRVVLERSGSTYKASEHDFLSSDSLDFHPTDVLEDADGSLLVIDTGGWFRNGCPTSQIAKPDVRGGIYRIRKVDQAKVADARGQKIDWKQQTSKQLVKLLDDARFEVRDKAVDELAMKLKSGNEEDFTALYRGSEESEMRLLVGTERQQMNIVWALSRNRLSEEWKELSQWWVPGGPVGKQAWYHALRETSTKPTVDWQILKEEPPYVRREAFSAFAKSRSYPVNFVSNPALPEVSGLATATGSTGFLYADRLEEHAGLYALYRARPVDGLSRLLSDTALIKRLPQMHRRAMFMLDQMDTNAISAELVIKAFDSDDNDVVKTATQIATRHPEWAPIFAAKLEEWLAIPRITDRQLLPLFELTPRYLKNEAMAVALGKLLQDDNQATPLLITKATGVKLHPSWKEPLARRLGNTNNSVAENALAAIAAVGGAAEFKPQLEATATNEAMPVVVRLKALSLSAPKGAAVSDSVFTLLSGQLQPAKPAAVRTEATKLLAGAALSQAQLLALAKLLPQCGPVELPVLITAFARSQDVAVGQGLVAGLRDANGLNNVKLADLNKVLRAYPEPVLSEANKLLADLEAQAKEQAGRLAELEKTISGGDAVRGQAVFYSEKAMCAVCHRVQLYGGQVGPDLSQIGRIRTERDLLEAILYPSASLARDFESYTVAMKDGESVSGVIQKETPEMIQLAGTTGQPTMIPRNTVASVTPSALSIMPQGLEQALSAQELKDLVAYLRSLK
ncbi:MAG TPA: PVC-type heme-binding CxxCH protein [Verrucomicrobiae bacterium]